MAINFYQNEISIKISNRLQLKHFIKQLFKEEKTELKLLSYVFCTDEYLLGINKEFLKHDDYTDIITFALSESNTPVIGEIYISVDRLLENSKKLKIPFNNELLRVVFHGALHLCGYKDKKASDKKRMTEAENKYLNLYLG